MEYTPPVQVKDIMNQFSFDTKHGKSSFTRRNQMWLDLNFLSLSNCYKNDSAGNKYLQLEPFTNRLNSNERQSSVEIYLCENLHKQSYILLQMKQLFTKVHGLVRI